MCVCDNKITLMVVVLHLVEFANVASVEPAILVDGGLCLFRILVVAFANDRSFDEHFTLSLGYQIIHVGNIHQFDADSVQRYAHVISFVMTDGGHCSSRHAFCLAISFQDLVIGDQ